MVKLTAILVVRNEARKIGRCLEALRWVDEIVVVDQSSEDATVEICRRYTANILVTANKDYCEPDRAVALGRAAHEWILYLDADEVVGEGLREEIRAILSGAPAHGCYYVPRRNIFMGKWIRGSGWAPGYVLRLFRKGSVRFSESIHTDLIPVSAPGYLKHQLTHYTCESFEEYAAKVNRYTSVMAREYYRQGARVTPGNCLFRLFILPAAYAAQRYILKAGFRDGFQGVVIAFLAFLTVALANCKVREIQERDGDKAVS